MFTIYSFPSTLIKSSFNLNSFFVSVSLLIFLLSLWHLQVSLTTCVNLYFLVVHYLAWPYMQTYGAEMQHWHLFEKKPCEAQSLWVAVWGWGIYFFLLLHLHCTSVMWQAKHGSDGNVLFFKLNSVNTLACGWCCISAANIWSQCECSCLCHFTGNPTGQRRFETVCMSWPLSEAPSGKGWLAMCHEPYLQGTSITSWVCTWIYKHYPLDMMSRPVLQCIDLFVLLKSHFIVELLGPS